MGDLTTGRILRSRLGVTGTGKDSLLPADLLRSSLRTMLPSSAPKLGPGTVGLHLLVGSSCKETDRAPGDTSRAAVTRAACGRSNVLLQAAHAKAAQSRLCSTPCPQGPGTAGLRGSSCRTCVGICTPSPAARDNPGKRCCRRQYGTSPGRGDAGSCVSLLSPARVSSG